MRKILLLVYCIFFADFALSEDKFWKLQIAMISESLKSNDTLCLNYGKSYLEKQQELALLVASSEHKDTEFILQAAVMANSLKDVKRFIKEGATFSTHKLMWGATLLHIAAVHANPKMMRYLVSQGIDINVKIPDTGVSPLHLAVDSNRRDNIEALVEMGADVNLRDSSNITPIVATVNCKDLSIFKYLLKKGAVVYPKVLKVAEIIGTKIDS